MGPRVVSWLINPTNCSYKHHKPYKHWSYLHQLSFLGFPLYIYIYTCMYGDRYWFAKVSSSWFDPLETKRAKISGICAGFHPNACVYIYIYLSMCLCIYMYFLVKKKQNYFYTKKNSNSMLDINCLSQVCQLFSSESDHGGRAFWGGSSTASQLTGRLVFLPFTYILHISIIPHDIQHQQKPHICWLLP